MGRGGRDHSFMLFSVRVLRLGASIGPAQRQPPVLAKMARRKKRLRGILMRRPVARRQPFIAFNVSANTVAEKTRRGRNCRACGKLTAS